MRRYHEHGSKLWRILGRKGLTPASYRANGARRLSCFPLRQPFPTLVPPRWADPKKGKPIPGRTGQELVGLMSNLSLESYASSRNF